MAIDPRWEDNQEVSRASHASADKFVPALERIVEKGSWREFVHPMQGLKQYRTFSEYCEDFLGWSAEAIEAVLDNSMFESAAIEVRRLIREGIPAATKPGEIGRGRKRVCDTKSNSDQQDASYVVARLKRDDPALAKQVVEGKVTPNAAAIKKGIRHQYARYRTNDSAKAVASLLKHFTAEEILRHFTAEQLRAVLDG